MATGNIPPFGTAVITAELCALVARAYPHGIAHAILPVPALPAMSELEWLLLECRLQEEELA